MPVQVCTQDDRFVRERMRWVVRLSDGDTVYEDDDRPGVTPRSAWIRLKMYCSDRGVHVARMWLQFRSNRVEVLPADAPGYFLVKNVFGVWGGDESYSAYIVGVVGDDGLVHTVRWKTPELVPLDRATRAADPASDSLILRNG